MNWLKQHRFAIVATGCVLVVLLLYHSSESFQSCINAKQNAGAERTFYKSIANFLVTLGIGRGCTGYFIQEAGNAITALATLLIAIFTWTLWRTSADQAQLTIVAIEDARLASQRELRAYIEALPLKMALLETGEIVASVILRNRGRTPAFSVRSTADFHIWPIPLDKPFRFEGSLEDSPQPIPTYVIYPDGEHLSAPRWTPTQSDIDKMKKGAGLYLVGLVTYLDAFGDRQWAEFCSYLDWRAFDDWQKRAGLKSGEMVPAAFRFSHLSNRASRS